MSGRKGHHKGLSNELNLISVVKELKESWDFDWIKDVRKSTREEDVNGIDVVIESDVGPLYLQCKSNPKEGQKFRKKQREGRYPSLIEVVVMKEGASKARAAKAIYKLRYLLSNGTP